MTAAVAVAAAFGLSSTAHATIQPLLTGAVVGPNTTVYTFQIALTPNNGLRGGVTDPSGLIILDFPGFLSASLSSIGTDVTTVGNWSLANVLTGGGTLPGVSPSGSTLLLQGSGVQAGASDSPDLQNIVLQYTGGGIPIATGPNNLNLLHLTVTSTARPGFPVLETLSRNTSALTTGQVDTFPIDSLGGTGIPEPASLGVLGLGVAGLLLKRRR